ncbi:MAG: hypothetical protein ACMUHX_10490 [bacterium]
MIREEIGNLSNIKLFLVITAVLLSMFMGLFLADAQETGYKEKWQEAELLVPNGDSLFNTFTFKGERDWYQFYADKGFTYQIFTRPAKDPVEDYNFPKILIYIFSDPESSYIVRNSSIEDDGSSFIEWTSPSSGLYYVSLKALDPDTYGNMEAYNIQITSIDCQDAHTMIPDVPDYSQSEFRNLWDCKVVAAACILGYWDAHGYSLLVDSNPDRIEDVKRLAFELNDAMQFSVDRSVKKIFTDENVREGIEIYCNLAKYGNNYNFSAEYYTKPDFSKVIDEIEEDRPIMYGVVGHPLWGNHWIVTVGYLETETTHWTINHDNWSSTHKDIYVDYDEATDCIITVHPDRKRILITSYPDIYSVYQFSPYPVVFPWLETLPTISFGTINTFSGIDNVSIHSWSSDLTGGYPKYSNPFDSVVSANVWGVTGNPDLYDYERSMSGDFNLSSFSSYSSDNPIGYYNINNYTTGNSYLISDQIPGLSLGPYLSFYSYTNFASFGLVAPFNNPFLSPFQTFFPTLGFFPYNVFSPFLSLSPSPFLFGALF